MKPLRHPLEQLISVVVALLCLGAVARAQKASNEPPDPAGSEYFAEEVYPILDEAQCRICHNDNGVASDTGLQFPRSGAQDEVIRRFGLGLRTFVDREHPERSLLLQKPTNRTSHTGGERIPRDSAEEKRLLSWVRYLAGLSETAHVGPADQAPTQPRKAKAIRVRRLTHLQYNNTVRGLLGDQTRPANQFPREDFIHGFKNQVEGQGISPLLAEAYSQAAEKVARRAFRGGDRQNLIPCEPVSPADTECRSQFIRDFGRKAFRRPLTQEEIANYGSLFDAQAELSGEFLDGARVVVEAMLQSPAFLFHAGGASQDRSYEIAARLSYFLWNTMPDAKLFQAAEAGELQTAAQIEKQARRMLEDPRARAAMEDFVAQWMRFDRVLETIRYRRLYPEFNSELAAAMTEETKRLFNHLVWEDKNFMEFFTADYGFVSTDLAALYGLPEPAEQFALTKFPPDSGRAGVLGQATFLTLTSKPSDTSPTERGLFIREHFLCQQVPPPPPGVNSNLPPVTDAKPMTNRERLQIHMANEACVSCHKLVDPIGFGFENYDAIGRFRAKHLLKVFPTREELQKEIKTEPTEYELDIDSSAFVQGIADSEFSTPQELGKVLAENRACQKCIVKQLFRYAMGRHETPAEGPVIDALYEEFRDSGFRFQELLIALVKSRVFLGWAS